MKQGGARATLTKCAAIVQQRWATAAMTDCPHISTTYVGTPPNSEAVGVVPLHYCWEINRTQMRPSVALSQSSRMADFALCGRGRKTTLGSPPALSLATVQETGTVILR